MRKWTKFLASAGLVLALAGSALTLAAVEDEIRQRIKPEGNVSIAGQSAEEAQAAQAPADRSGNEVYASACSACHDSGAAGAPKLGNSGDWAARFEQDTETLYNHAINGFNAMPAKGGCSGCSDQEVKNAVDYIIAETE
jgi:cytochrome c5